MAHISEKQTQDEAKRADRGDYNDNPQQPADMTHRAQRSVESGSSNVDEQKRPHDLKKAVNDLDSGLAVKP